MNQLNESSARTMEQVRDAIEEVQRELEFKRQIAISEVARIAQRHGLNPANILRSLANRSDCWVDWPNQIVRCN